MNDNEGIWLIIAVMILIGLPSLADAPRVYITDPGIYKLWRAMLILFFIFMVSLIIKC